MNFNVPEMSSTTPNGNTRKSKSFGFVPVSTTMEQPNATSGTPVVPGSINPITGKVNEDPATTERKNELMSKVARQLQRYPKLQLRTTFKLAESLESYTEEQLENIFFNAQQDIHELNGAPVATSVLVGFVKVLNACRLYIDDGEYEAELVGDEPLKQDLEFVIADYIGVIGEKINICFRMFNDYLIAQTKRKRKLEQGSQAAADTDKKDEEGESEPALKRKCQENKTRDGATITVIES